MDEKTAGSQGGNGGQKPHTLSWSQPQQGKQNSATPNTTSLVGPKMPTPAKTSLPTGQSSSSSKVTAAFIIGLIIGGLVTWSWFGLRNSNSGTMALDTTSTSTSSSDTSSGLTMTGSSATGGTSGTAASGSTSSSVGEATMTAVEPSSDTITVPSPQNAGMSVQISTISGSDPVWAVVYEDNNGVRGVALGAARFTSNRTGTIELLRATLPNLTYFVGLTNDSSNHMFSVKSNPPLINNSGTQIMTQFTAQ